jgi:hypothetical protein
VTCVATGEDDARGANAAPALAAKSPPPSTPSPTHLPSTSSSDDVLVKPVALLALTAAVALAVPVTPAATPPARPAKMCPGSLGAGRS